MNNEAFLKYRNRAVARKKQILEIPRILEYETLLYIGASPDRFEMIDIFYYADYEIDVLEVFEPNVNSLRLFNERWKIFDRIMLGDVRKVEEILQHEYDIILFWHGPEHLPKEDIEPTLAKLEDFAKHLIICGGPWGEYAQGAVKGNPFEKHLTSLFPKDFRKLGFTTSKIRKKPGRGSNLLAWKEINK